MAYPLYDILAAFGLDQADRLVLPHGAGLINRTWKVCSHGNEYILQQINKSIFKSPADIAMNVEMLGRYLKQKDHTYLFAGPLLAANGTSLVLWEDQYYRLSPFVKDSYVHQQVSGPKQAFQAAKQFAKFSGLLRDFDVHQLRYTLPDFHNLNVRAAQFKHALATAGNDRLKSAEAAIGRILKFEDIADMYSDIVNSQLLPLRVMHHDTKISNVLFDHNDNGLCVIDLDTVMPGYFLSDVGDMMRTYVSQANEDERDINKITLREDVFSAVVAGYLSEMGNSLTETEKSLFVYSGKMMIYMQALRFLTDFLNGDIYYHIEYQGHNLARAINQITLLGKYSAQEHLFNETVKQYST